MRAPIAFALAGILLLAGCSDDPAQPLPTTPAANAPRSTAPAPTGTAPVDVETEGSDPDDATSMPTPGAPTPTITVNGEAAQKRYLDLAADYNAAFFATTKEDAKASPDLAVLTRESGKAAAALRRFVADLRATAWPSEIQPLADALADSAEADVAPWEESARATSLEQWRAVEFPPEDGAAAKMREALVLPAVPTDE